MRLIKSFGFAFTGLMTSMKGQQNIRIHLIAFLLVCLAGFYFEITRTDWCIILLASGLVIGLELVNTSIENLTDLVTKERNSHAEKVKDIAAASVLFASIIAIVIGLIIFAKYL